jgi:hypothetical protein
MADFSNEKAKIQGVYFRRVFAGGREAYERQPYNLVEYDDNSGSYIVPMSDGVGLSARTWGDVHNPQTIPTLLILDSGEPWAGITEIR